MEQKEMRKGKRFIMNTEVKRGFKKKTIAANIKEKLDDWFKSIDDKELVQEIKDHVIVTGGCIASMLQGDLPNDYDIYFSNVDTAAKVAQYYLNKLPEANNDKVKRTEVRKHENRIEIFIKSAGIASEETDQSEYDYFEMYPDEASEKYLNTIINQPKSGYRVAYMSSNAITLTGNIQIITRFVGDPQEIHKNFDFVHCTNWFTYKDGVVLNQKALESILAKELKYVGSLYPICSIFRIRKFIKRGWSITAGEIFKISYDIAKLNLDDPIVLKEQLVGVDAAYFHQLLGELQKPENKDLDRTYLFELVNRIFDEEI